MNPELYWSEDPLDYTGSQLRPHFLLNEFKLKGSAIAGFQGACQVKTADLVDLEDQLNEDRIEAKEMVHFIGEFFGSSLREGVWFQHCFAAVVAEHLNFELKRKDKQGSILRKGNDLFLQGASKDASLRKLSVSIVTASPVSSLFHFGINLDPKGAPVAAAGLYELNVQPKAFVSGLFEAVREEFRSIDWACAKVRPVI